MGRVMVKKEPAQDCEEKVNCSDWIGMDFDSFFLLYEEFCAQIFENYLIKDKS